MRKFTVSAIIFTALTGCSQSNEMSSAQWSFEAPAEKDINGTQTDGTYSKNTPTVDLSAMATSAIGADSANIPTTSQQLMTPTLTHSVVKSSDTVRPSSVAGITSSRSDFLEQIHAYLQASNSPSALTHRTPSASQVYLTTLPTVGQSQPSDLPSPLLGSSGTLSAGLSAENSSGIDALTNAAYGEVVQPTIDTSNVAIPPAASFEDNLPQLAPAQPIDFTALPAIVPTNETGPNEEISIGTTILRDLQRSSLATTATTATTTTVSNSSTLTQQTITQPIAAQTQPAGTDLISDNIARPPVAFTPTFTARVSDDGPTLARLIQTMPQRELSPLVASRQGSIDSTQSAQPAAGPAVGPLEYPDASTTAYAPTYALYSPLLAGLNAAEIQSTVYVPALNTTSSHLSRALLQDTGIEKDTSRAVSVDEISFQNVFSSKLTLATLLDSETTTALNPKAVTTALPSAPEKTPEKAISRHQKTQTAPQVFWSKRFLSSLSQPSNKRHQLIARR